MTSIPCTHVCIQRNMSRHMDPGREIQCLGSLAGGTKLPVPQQLCRLVPALGEGRNRFMGPKINRSPLLLAERRGRELGPPGESWLLSKPPSSLPVRDHTPAPSPYRGSVGVTPVPGLREPGIYIRAGRVPRGQIDKCPQVTAAGMGPREGETPRDPPSVRSCASTGAQVSSPAQGSF